MDLCDRLKQQIDAATSISHTNREDTIMSVREGVPDSIAFTIELRLSTVKRYRVQIVMDLQTRFISMPAGVLPDVLDRLNKLIPQLIKNALN